MAERGAEYGGSGSERPVLEQRVGALEMRMDRVETRLSAIELLLAEIKGQLSQLPKASDFAALKADIAEMKGRMAGLPTTWQLLVTVIGTWTSGAAIVFALLKFGVR